MRKKDKPILSFCIPTYNRAHVVNKAVKSILKYQGDDIEVVVSDNCSIDNTLEELNKINDKRLKVYTNNSNLGFERNVFKCFENANGEYCFYLNDREIVYIKKIKDLINLLYKTNYDLILTSVKNIDKTSVKRKIKEIIKSVYYRNNLIHSYIYYEKSFYQKTTTLKKIFDRGHPTGIVVRKETINFKNLYENYTFGTLYPHVFLMLQVYNKNENVFFSKKFYSATMTNPYGSHTIQESQSVQYRPYYHPLSRFAQMKDKMKWLDFLNLTNEQEKEMLYYLYMQMCKASVHSPSFKNKNFSELKRKMEFFFKKGEELFQKEITNDKLKSSLIELGESFIKDLLDSNEEALEK